MAELATPTAGAIETTLELAVRLWWLWLIVGAVLLVRAVRSVVRERRLVRAGIYDIDRMDGREFERYLEALFARLGYRVEQTPSGDGADLVLEKDRCRTAVQARRHAKPVGLRAIQDVANDVELWDREQLVRRLLAGQDVAIEAAPDPA